MDKSQKPPGEKVVNKRKRQGGEPIPYSNVCAVKRCRVITNEKWSYFRFPKDRARCIEWATVCGCEYLLKNYPNQDLYSSMYRVCHKHFEEDCFVKTSSARRLLTKSAMPTLNLPTTSQEIKLEVSETETVKIEETQEENNIEVKTEPTELLGAVTLEGFKLLCDQFIPSCADFIKVQAVLQRATMVNPDRNFEGHSNEFLRACLKIYFQIPKAYTSLERIFTLLPTKRTLKKFIQNYIEFVPGLNDSLFEILELKIRNLQTNTSNTVCCCICLHEVSLKSHLFYNISGDEVVGLTDDGTRKIFQPALRALALTIKLPSCDWKLPVAYYFLHKSCNPNELQEIIPKLVGKLKNIGLLPVDVLTNNKEKIFGDVVGTPVQFLRAFQSLFKVNLFCPTGIENNDIETNWGELLKHIPTNSNTESINNADHSLEPSKMNLESLEQNSLSYTCAFLIRKCLSIHKCDLCEEYANNQQNLDEESLFAQFQVYKSAINVNRSNSGNLCMPHDNFFFYICELNEIFKLHFEEIVVMRSNCLARLSEYCSIPKLIHPCEHFPHTHMFKLYARMRLFYALKFANRNFKFENATGMCVNGKMIIWEHS